MRFACALLVVALGTIVARAGAGDAVLPEGVRVVWDFGKAVREGTGTRGRVCLNGLWRWRPAVEGVDAVPAGGGWGFVKVPGNWPGSRGDYMWSDSQRFYPAAGWKEADLRKVVVGWYEREFTVPAEWRGRRLAVAMAYLYSAAAVYVDGKKVGEAYFPGGEVDVTGACAGGGKHVLSIRVAAVPLGEETTYFAENGAGTKSKATVQLRGLCGDVFLVGTPAGARLTDAKVETSVGRWELAVLAGVAGLDAGKEYRLRAVVRDRGKVVHEMTSGAFKGAEVKGGRFVFRGGWRPEKLWDLNTPGNQYEVSVSLVDGQGAEVDTLLPVRFGFREFRIDGRDFRLNGSRFHGFAVPLDSAQVSAAAASYAGARETLRRLKSFGVNLVYTHNYGCVPGQTLGFEEILRAADDEGMLVSFSMPHVNAYDWRKSDAQAARDYARHAEFYVRAAQNHPSVVMYAMNHNLCGYADEHNPDHMDGRRDMTGEIRQPDDRNAKLAVRAEGIVREMDATRVIYHHGGANLGQTFTLNIYLNHVPSQERCDWFGHWATEGIKPLFLAEYGTPSDIDWTTYRGWFRGERSWGNGAVTYETCFPEWGAQYRGDKAYDVTEKEKVELRWEAKAWRRGVPWHRWDYPINFPSDKLDIPNILDVMAMYVTDDWRAFRTWGVSAFNSWELHRMWKLREGFRPSRKELKVDWETLQRPGYSADFLDRQHEQFEYAYEASDWEPTVAARAVIRNSGPVLAYVAGGAGHVTEKGHNYRAGETVEKQVIVINESRAPVTFDCRWTWNVERAIDGKATFVVETGEQRRVPIECKLPADLAAGAYDVTLTVTPSVGEVQRDEFRFHVLPAGRAVKVAGRVGLFDPKGETGALLKRLGVKFEAVGAGADLAGFDVLVVGKGALSVTGAGPDVRRVREGLKVVVFEQTAEVLEKRLGFHVEEYGLRQVFRRLPDHPALAGLTEETLANWRGEATIMPPQLVYKFDKYQTPKVEWCGLPVTRPWRCGNRGNVASVLIEKPGRGDFLPIVDGGFSLQYSPLLEMHEGRGVVVFCQMDVTGRTVGDPAADLLVRNLLEYVEGFKAPEVRSARYVGEEAGRKYLEGLGIGVKAYEGGGLAENEVLVVGPGGGREVAKSAGVVGEFVKAGGRVIGVGLDEGDVKGLPVKVSMKRGEYISAAFEAVSMGSAVRGVGPADLDNRDPREIWLVAGGEKVYGGGVMAEEGNVVLCQLAPWWFDDAKLYNLKRSYRRVSFAVVRLLANAGVSGGTAVLERMGKGVGEWERRYMEGLYVDRPEEWDDPYRFFCW